MAYHARRGNLDQIIEDLVEMGICESKFVVIFTVEVLDGLPVFDYGIMVNCG